MNEPERPVLAAREGAADSSVDLCEGGVDLDDLDRPLLEGVAQAEQVQVAALVPSEARPQVPPLDVADVASGSDAQIELARAIAGLAEQRLQA